ncbi:PLP-dependent cysteine synthase family protein (plasmid) [Streptomycetaceae bacterium NBC_01309]
MPRVGSNVRDWVSGAIRTLESESARSADTHLIHFPLPRAWNIDLYLKDESAHPSGSLKHRLARSLFLYGLCNGWIGPDTTVVEASSGSTAVSEAYFANLLGLRFVAVMPKSVSAEKTWLIERFGGECRFVAGPADVQPEARRLAADIGGHFLDQFTYAERATDWRGNNNIAESIFEQLARERHPVPEWIVAGAGTGGTSATIGRYLRYRRFASRLLVVDPENSAFYGDWSGADEPEVRGPLRIEGIGRPHVEPSFLPGVVDRMMRVPDAGSVAAMRLLHEFTGRRAGPSTGTNLYGALRLVAEMREQGRVGSVVTLLCDNGERYTNTFWDDEWVRRQDLDAVEQSAALRGILAAVADPRASGEPGADRSERCAT